MLLRDHSIYNLCGNPVLLQKESYFPFEKLQNVIVVDPSSCDEDDDVFGESDLLSKTIVVDSSLGETRLVRSLND